MYADYGPCRDDSLLLLCDPQVHFIRQHIQRYGAQRQDVIINPGMWRDRLLTNEKSFLQWIMGIENKSVFTADVRAAGNLRNDSAQPADGGFPDATDAE
jgi:hypothetical protein